MRLLVDRRPQDRTIGVALLLPVGSFAERPGEDGLAHLIEHLLFKRTPTKPPAVLRRLENDAGFVDAFTDRDHTGFLCRTLPEDLPKTLDYLQDVVFRGSFTAGDLDAEKQVVEQEISEDADDPWAVAYDAYARRAFGRYGRPVGGNPRTVRSFGVAQVRRFVRENYRPEQAVLAVAGPVDERRVRRLVRLPRRRPSPESPRASSWADFSPLPRYWSPSRSYRMGYLCWGFPFRRLGLRDLQILRVFAATTGEGPSSILWRELREKRGLVYDFSGGVDRYTHAVSCHFSLAARPGRVRACLDVLGSVTDAWRRGKIAPDDVRVGLKVVSRGELARGEDPLDWAAWRAYAALAGIGSDEPARIAATITPDEVISRIAGGLLPAAVVGRT